MPPEWSQCQCERNNTSMVGQVDRQSSGVRQPDVAVRTDVEQHRGRVPPVTGGDQAENPWQATQSWSRVTTQSWPSCWPVGVPPSRYAISGSCGMPGLMLESVSVALSTTIVMVSSSSGGAVPLATRPSLPAPRDRPDSAFADDFGARPRSITTSAGAAVRGTAPRGARSAGGSGAAARAPTSCVRRGVSWWRARGASGRWWRRRGRRWRGRHRAA